MEKNDLINKLKDQTYAKLAPSEIHGIGVVALKDIPKNTIVFAIPNADEYKGEFVKVSGEELDELGLDIKKSLQTLILKEVNEDAYIFSSDGIDNLPTRAYLNHSTEPNLSPAINSEGFKYVSNRRIKQDEELTVNYFQFGKELDIKQQFWFLWM